jgi:hypothetical protein
MNLIRCFQSVLLHSSSPSMTIYVCSNSESRSVRTPRRSMCCGSIVPFLVSYAADKETYREKVSVQRAARQ